MLLPPAKIEWQLEADMREVTVGFGFEPIAYMKGKSNGAELILELVDHSQIRTIYRCFLDPQNKVDDREPQSAVITLPPFATGTRLVLRTDPGPYGDTAWDWIYLDNLQLKRAPGFISTQFPGFNRAPDVADASQAIIALSGAERLLILPGSSTLTYVLRGNEQRLQFEYGFQPDTAGDAVYRVELQHAGQPSTILFERHLQPALRPADQGRQKIDLLLGTIGAGDRLMLRIDPAANGDGNSNQTYISEFDLQ